MNELTSSGREWTSWHLHLGSAARTVYDRVLTEVIGPAVSSLPGRPWFFIRYWQAGPHLRLRVAGLDTPSSVRVEQSLRRRLEAAGKLTADEDPVSAAAYRRDAGQLAAAGDTGPDRVVQDLLPPGVYRAAYEPEFDRYGGPDLMPRTERLFQMSSELVLTLLPRLREPRHRSLLALRGTMSAAATLGGRAEQASYYRHGERAWRAMAARSRLSDHQLEQWCRLTRGSGVRAADPADHGPFGPWHAALADLVGAVAARPASAPVGLIISSHVHMLHNRLGLSPLDELRTYAWLTQLFPPASPAPAHGNDRAFAAGNS